jgi:hypothetical protein
MRRSKPSACWYEDLRYRMRFESPARQTFRSLSCTQTGKGRKAEIIYRLTVSVPEYAQSRRITIRLTNYKRPFLVGVSADGPTNSPHRYSSGHLCIWYPSDGPELKWQPDEGLLGLIQYTRVHLYREAYWRQFGFWPGPEAPHGETKEPEAA